MGVDLVSIVMPMSDAMPYLTECIDSIRVQSYEHWELIIVDDGSTDDSRVVAGTYTDRDERVRCIANDGRGIIDALRLAYAHSSGALITRMDADDIMTPDRLEVMVRSLAQSGQGHVAVGGVQYFATGRELGDGYRRYEQWLNRLTSTGSNWDEIYKECSIPSPCWMLWREDFEQVGAFDDDVYPEDYDLALRMYQTGLEVIPCDQVLHHWRDYGDRTSRNDPHYADNRFLDLKCHHFLQHDRDDLRSLVVWGTGRKGKAIIKYYQEKYIDDLHWVTDNPNKIGHSIYDIIVQSTDILVDLDLPQIIVAVANDDEQAEIRDRLGSMGYCSMIDYFFFC